MQLLPVKINMGYKKANGHSRTDRNENFSWGDTIVNVVVAFAFHPTALIVSVRLVNYFLEWSIKKAWVTSTAV